MPIYSPKRKSNSVELPIAPMIDVVFLLLIYFMVSSTIQKQEADISFALPGTVQQDEPLNIPDEQIIYLSAEGQASVNDFAYDSPKQARFSQLARMLTRFKQASDANRVEARITIAPDDATPHQMIVKAMDACAIAEIDAVTFAVD